MLIEVDYREKKLIKLLKSLLNLYKFKNIEIEVKNLPLGDIIIKEDENSELLIIERKSINDLASSIRDGRYKEQSLRLSNTGLHNHRIIYLIEGDISMWSNRYSNIKSETLYVSLFSLLYYKGFSLLRTVSLAESGEMILRICDKLNRSKKKKYFYDLDMSNNEIFYSNSIKREKKENITINNIDEIMLSQIPNISVNIARNIIKKFGNLSNLINNLKEDEKCLNEIEILGKDDNLKRLNNTVKSNLCKYLLKKEEKIIRIND